MRNGVRGSLGDLQGVDLLRGFEKISSWREGGSPVRGEEFAKPVHVVAENGFGRDMKNGEANYVHGAVNGNGVPATAGGESVSQNGTVHTEEEDLVDSQMTEVR